MTSKWATRTATPGFTEAWFGQESQLVLADLVTEVADIEGLIVEVGSWEGRSTIAMANAAHPRLIDAVDTWAGSPGEVSATLAASRDVFAQWAINIDTHTQGNVTPYIMGWRDYVPTITEPVALLFIDAEHTYKEVHDTIEAFLPLMADGAIICGDDQHHPPIRQALDDLFGLDTISVAATVWISRQP